MITTLAHLTRLHLWKIGHAYFDGDKGFKQSDQDGAYWFFRAALLGQPQAQFQLGRLYSKGTGVEENVQEAYKWYNKSANAGYAPAQHNVAVYLMEGKGVSKNTTEGADWFRRAATQNHKRSQRSLAGVYFLGDGVEQNLTYAYMWGLIYAQDDLEGESQAMLDLFAKHMSKKEIEDAYKKAVFCLQNTLAKCELNNAKFR